MDATTEEEGLRFPKSFKFWYQVGRSKEAEETHAYCGPVGKAFTITEVAFVAELGEQGKGEVGFSLRFEPRPTTNSFEASGQGGIRRFVDGDFDTNRNVQRWERSDVISYGAIGDLVKVQPGGKATEQRL
jgi:hypothetical protein